jgi:hypothetical protein
MTENTSPTETPKNPKFNKKWLAAFALPIAVIGGAGVASAQTGDEAPEDSTVTEEGQRPEGRRGHRGSGLRGLSEALDLEGSEIRELIEGGQTVAEIAADQGVDIDAFIAAQVAKAQAHADENGKEDFDAAALTERLTAMANGAVQLGGGHRGPKGPSDAVQELLGLDGAAIKAAGQGVSTDDLVSTIIDDIEDRMVASDREVPEDFDIADLTQRVTDRVNGEGPERPEGHQGRRGPGGPGAGPNADAPATDAGTV